MIMSVNQFEAEEPRIKCKSRAEHRKLLKKEKRRKQRQEAARLREEHERNNEAELSPTRLQEVEERERQLDHWREQDRKKQHKMWLEREKQAQDEFLRQQEKEDMLKKKEDEERKRIQAEWEEEQKKEQEILKKEQTKKDKKQQQLEGVLQYLDQGKTNGEKPWRNPDAPTPTPGSRKAETCSFFMKTGACRFGDRCSRNHPDPGVSRTVVLKGMYSNYAMEQSYRDEYDTDISLEYDHQTAYEDFLEFYSDTLPEFEKIGKVLVMKVCCNWEQHLRGNVFVQYQHEEEGTKAVEAFNGRYYAGKCVSCTYVALQDWRAAICGLYPHGKCPKGKNCNYLHVFKDPKEKDAVLVKGYRYRDRRSHSRPYHNSRRRREYPVRHWQHRLGSERRHHSWARSRSRSRSKSTERKGSTSRSPGGERSYSRRRSRLKRKSSSSSKSRSRSRSSSRSSSKSRSKSRSRSRSRSRSKSRSRVRSLSRSRSRSKTRSRSRSRSRSRKRARSRLHSKSKSHKRSKKKKHKNDRDGATRISKTSHKKKGKIQSQGDDITVALTESKQNKNVEMKAASGESVKQTELNVEVKNVKNIQSSMAGDEEKRNEDGILDRRGSSISSGNEAESEDSDSSNDDRVKLEIVEREIARLTKKADEKDVTAVAEGDG